MKAELIQSMGSDLTVVNAARVSFDKESEWEKEEVVGHLGANAYLEGYSYILKEKDQKLIHYLARNSHWTPFAHCTITLRETVPIFVARQRFKHTVGFVYNEVSRRYVDDDPEFFYPGKWRGRSDNKKQGSDGLVDNQEHCTEEYWLAMRTCYAAYKELLKEGVAPEQARMVLPQSMYTSYYVTGSLSAFARAYNLRSDSHAQKEIQDLAKEWKRLLEPLYPVSWGALCGSS